MGTAGSLVAPSSIRFERDDEKGRLRVFIQGEEKWIYQYHPALDLPHYWPFKSPSGKNMLLQQGEPYPHHRAFWFADTVRFDEGREVSFYNALYSGQKKGENTYSAPFRDHIRHVRFTRLEVNGNRAEIEKELVWEMDGDIPVLDEHRQVMVYDLGQGEYFLDLQFGLTASYGEVEFVSDDVHYAWPYLRMQPAFSGENGGEITSDSGARGQESTNMEYALWIDYSNTVDGVTEGVAVFQWPDGQKHRWLTREYGTFGPRRPDEKSGQVFTLKKGKSIVQRVGILVHMGDVKTGKVSERYQKYIQQK
jgi:hypothetical protein